MRGTHYKACLKKRIFIVEDEEGLSRPLSYRLTNWGYEVSVAEDGKQALDKANRERPDLILLDWMLPELSGEEVCKAIRESVDASLSQTPIIMMTGKTSYEDRVVGTVAGANAYLTQPFRAEDLLKEIQKFAASSTFDSSRKKGLANFQSPLRPLSQGEG